MSNNLPKGIPPEAFMKAPLTKEGLTPLITIFLDAKGTPVIQCPTNNRELCLFVLADAIKTVCEKCKDKDSSKIALVEESSIIV
jgi:hypothetical protein